MALDLELGESIRLSQSGSLLESESLSPNKLQKTDADSVLNMEMSEAGNLKFGVFASYWKSVGHLLCLSILLAVVLMQVRPLKRVCYGIFVIVFGCADIQECYGFMAGRVGKQWAYKWYYKCVDYRRPTFLVSDALTKIPI